MISKNLSTTTTRIGIAECLHLLASIFNNQSHSIIVDEAYCKALLSVYDKANLLDLASGLHGAGVRLLGSGGTAKKIREAGIPIE